MHHDVTLNDVTANINQRYSNSLLIEAPRGFIYFKHIPCVQIVECGVKSKSEGKKRREIREDHPLPYPLAIFPAHIFLRRPHNLN